MQEMIDVIERIIQLFGIDKEGSFYVIYIILFVFALGWILPKSKEVGSWKELFSKNKIKEMQQARDMLQSCDEESEFYEEAMRQEIFHKLIGIRCRKEYRETYQRLVREGIASTEGIRLAYLFIHNKNSKIEIKFGVFSWIRGVFLIIQLLLGTLLMPRFLFDLLRNLNLHTFSSRLLGLSVATLFCFGALKALLPMALALSIRKRLRKLEEENNQCAVSPFEQIRTTCEQDTVMENGEL